MTRSLVEQDGPLAKGIEMYKLDVGVYPQHLSDLVDKPAGTGNAEKWKGPYIKDAKSLNDSWDQPLLYRTPGKRNPESYDLWSRGPDGQDGTRDDIGNWRRPARGRRAR